MYVDKCKIDEFMKTLNRLLIFQHGFQYLQPKPYYYYYYYYYYQYYYYYSYINILRAKARFPLLYIVLWRRLSALIDAGWYETAKLLMASANETGR